MAKKSEKYLPLKWVDKFDFQFYDIFDRSLSPEDIRIYVEEKYSFSEKVKVLNRNPCLAKIDSTISKGDDHLYREYMRDMDCLSMVLAWTKNKQVYAFDEDFIDELANTKTVIFSENAWDYLPYDMFYVDLSANQRVCKEILGNGFFVKVEKVEKNLIFGKTKSHYNVHLCKVTDELFFNDLFGYANTDMEKEVDEFFDAKTIPITKANDLDYSSVEQRTEAFNGRLYSILVPQILTYLSSVEPDIEENEETKRTYRKPAPDSTPKNKFSEVQKWDIGVRFGTAFRKWKKQNATADNSGGRSGKKQRPHSRRAHWSHYWYGSGDNKVRRAKWISAYFVNVDKPEELPTVIHKTEK